MKSRLICIFFCLVLLLAGFLYTSHEVFAPIKYRLGTGDEIDFTAVTKTNQGPGSGLDADKLDGLNSTVFLQSSSSASNTFDLGDGQNNTNKIYKFNIGGANLPGVRYNAQTGKVQFSHDGTSWSDMGTGGGSAPNVENNDTLVATNPSVLDFSSKFSVTESPAGEANINLASGGVTSTEIADGTIANADVSASAAIAESKLSLNFATHSNTNDPTAGEKAALAGTNGIPSGTNKYVTDSDARNTNARTPTAHGASLHDTTVEATANKDAASGYAGLDAGSLVNQAVKKVRTFTDPATPAPGEVWINSKDFKYRDNQATPATQTIEIQTNKGVANGYASLGASGLVPTAQLGTGVADSTKVLKGDGTWGASSGGQTAKVYFAQVLPTASTTSTTYVAIGAGLSVTFTPASATNVILVDVVTNLVNGSLMGIQLEQDGTIIHNVEADGAPRDVFTITWRIVNLTAASHTFEVKWRASAGTTSLYTGTNALGAVLRVVEFS